jgi:SAM-dependent methyltransferase
MDDSLQLTARKARSLRGEQLLQAILEVPIVDRDAWIDVLLELGELPEDAKELPREAVPYLPCGVAEILAMVRELPLRASDRIVDLGSGLGRVVLLAHLLTGARAHGIELQPQLVDRARALSAARGLEGVTFEAGDASGRSLEGTVFFLYAPFSGQMLERALEELHQVAKRHPIAVCAVDLQLDQARWLRARKTSSLALTIYECTR